jgi:hypothetical protein
MKRKLGFAGRSATIITSIAALASLGGAAYAAGRPSGPSAGLAAAAHSRALPSRGVPASTSAPTFRWHLLALTHGWSGLINQGTSNPAYAIVGGVVYLRGVMSGGFGADFAILPKAARPIHTLWISFVTEGPTNSGLRILHDGTMSAFGNNAPGFTSLCGISYPVSE